jgi:hypothetical protein
MSVIEFEVEDPKRRLLETCRHSAPACWRCLANDMERQRDAAESRSAALAEALRGLADKWTADVEDPDYEFEGCAQEVMTEHAAALRALASSEGTGTP